MIYSTKKEGFTLVELIVVMAVIGILSTVVFMSFGTARENARIKKETSTVEMFKLNMRLYREQTGHYPPSADICSACSYNANSVTTKNRWKVVADALTPTYTPMPIYEDVWGNPYAYDNNYRFPNESKYTYLCSVGSNERLETGSFLLTATPSAGGDDICVFFR